MGAAPTGVPSACATKRQASRSVRGRLPMWVVRMRSVLRFMLSASCLLVLRLRLAIRGTRRVLADLSVAHILAHLRAGAPQRIAIAAAARGLDDQTVALVQRRGG